MILMMAGRASHVHHRSKIGRRAGLDRQWAAVCRRHPASRHDHAQEKRAGEQGQSQQMPLLGHFGATNLRHVRFPRQMTA